EPFPRRGVVDDAGEGDGGRIPADAELRSPAEGEPVHPIVGGEDDPECRARTDQAGRFRARQDDLEGFLAPDDVDVDPRMNTRDRPYRREAGRIDIPEVEDLPLDDGRRADEKLPA